MATIGTFTRTNGNGSFTGAVKTLSINAKTTIKPADKLLFASPPSARARSPRSCTSSSWTRH